MTVNINKSKISRSRLSDIEIKDETLTDNINDYKSPDINKNSISFCFIYSITFLNTALCSNLLISPKVLSVTKLVKAQSKCMSAICTNFIFISFRVEGVLK